MHATGKDINAPQLPLPASRALASSTALQHGRLPGFRVRRFREGQVRGARLLWQEQGSVSCSHCADQTGYWICTEASIYQNLAR